MSLAAFRIPQRPWARRLAVAALVLTAGLVVLTILFARRVPLSSGAARQAVVDLLAERLDADVDLDTFEVRVFPRLTASGANLTIRHRGRRDVPALISVRAFRAESTLGELWRRRVTSVRLDGLRIRIPPRREPRADDEAPDRRRPGRAPDVLISELVTSDAQLMMLPRDPSRPPRTWHIHALRLESVGAESAMPYAAVLTNAVPPGRIDTTGTFGPWTRDEPGDTPLGGTFSFDEADLGVFKGIAGTLSSKGAFGGTLGRIEVQGITDTPDFALSAGGLPVHLSTTYHAVVDGTDGDTRLERVDARLGDTPIEAEGIIAHAEDVRGRRIALDVTIDGGRLEDVLRLAVPAEQPPMTGALSLEASLALPPGDEDVVRRLELDGAFSIDGGRFADPQVQRQINELSQRARGRRTGDAAAPRVASDFSGTFRLDGGVLHLTPVTFDVPGALVELTGRYALDAETLDFSGSLYMDARVSETTSGFRRLLLKIVDPLFRKGGRTVVPLKVTGPRSSPSFGLDMARVLRR